MLRQAVFCSLAASLLLVPLAAQHRWSLPSAPAPRAQPVVSKPAAIQDVARRDVAGSVRGSDGAPWPDAAVVLYSTAVQPLPELAPADEVAARTDERGRFRAGLLPGRLYVARAEIGGSNLRLSKIARDVRAEQTVLLVEADEQPIEVEARLYGIAAWREVPGTEIQVTEIQVTDELGRTLPLVVGAEGQARLPPSLGAACTIVLSLAGQSIASRLVRLMPEPRETRRASWVQRAESAAKRPVATGLPDITKEPAPALAVEHVFLALPQRATLTTVVVNGETRTPIAGAALIPAGGGRTDAAPIARTDAAGKATVVVARALDEFGRASASREASYLVVAKGYAIRRCGWTANIGPADLTHVPTMTELGPLPELDVVLVPELALKGQVVGTSTLPAGGRRLMVQRPVRAPWAHGGSTTILTSEVTTTGTGGQWRLGGFTDGAVGLRASLVLTSDEVARLFPGRTTIDEPYAFVDLEPPKPPDATTPEAEAKAIELASLGLVDLLVRDPDGAPASFARLETATASGYRGGYETVMYADRRGRCRLLLPATSTPHVVHSAAGYGIHDLAPNLGRADLELTLQPFAVVRGVVVDASAKPVAGASVRWRSTRSTGGMDASARLLDQVNRRAFSATTGDDGRFELRFAPVASRSYGIGATKSAGEQSLSTPSNELVWVDRDSIDDVTIPLAVDARAARPAAANPAPAEPVKAAATATTGVAPAALPPIPERSQLLGTVRGKDGAPWPGATVSFHAASPLHLPELCPADTVEVVADERGRFRADLLSCRGYSVLATLEAGGSPRFSTLARDVAAGPPLHLVEAAEQPMAVELRFLGLDPWLEHKPTLEIEDALGRRRQVELKASGVTLSPRLGPNAMVRLVTPATGVLMPWYVSLVPSTRESNRKQLDEQRGGMGAALGDPFPGLPDLSQEPLPPIAVERLLLGPPQRVHVTVTSRETKKPIAGARLRWGDPWTERLDRPEKLTGPDGSVEVLAARRVDSFGRRLGYETLTLHATAAGHAAGIGGWAPTDHGWGMEPLREENLQQGVAKLEMTLPPGHSWTGRVTLPAGVDGSGLRLQAQMQAMHEIGPGRQIYYSRNLLLAADATGTFAIDGFHGSTPSPQSLTLLVPQKVAASLIGAPVRGTHAVLRITQLDARATEAKPAVIDLTPLRAVDLLVRQPDGAPAGAARIQAWARDGNWPQPIVFTEPRGRGQLVTSEATLQVLALDAESFGLHETTLAKAAAPIDVQLRRCATLEGRILDDDGAAVAGATLYNAGWSQRSASPFASIVMNANGQLLQATSSEDGRFRLRFIPLEGTSIGIGARIQQAGRTVFTQGAAVQIEQDSITGAEIVLPFSQKMAAGSEPVKR